MSRSVYRVRIVVTRMEEYGDTDIFAHDEYNSDLKSTAENAIIDLDMFAYNYEEPAE